MKLSQGDLLKVEGIRFPVIVVSGGFFNASGKAVVCPIVRDAADGPLHIPLKEGGVEGRVLCEQVKYLDLSARRFSRLGAAHYYDVMDISDAIMGIFDYQR